MNHTNRFRIVVLAGLVGVAAAFAAQAVAQEDHPEMGKSCDWLKRTGIKTVAPSGDYTIKVAIDLEGTVFWNGQAMENRKVLMDKVAEQKKLAKEFPATLIEAHEKSPRFYVQPVFRIFSDAKVVPACRTAAPSAVEVVAPPAVEAAAPAAAEVAAPPATEAAAPPAQ
ncbi:MAG: hypothetical protein Q8R02_09915 [Hyphomonadaceae bacterium]|nr:hypothetical protein [Hyphomonadaceae bacterium]